MEATVVNIPKAFKSAQQRIFQDKAVEHYKPLQSTGKLGSITTEPAEIPAGFYCLNFRIVSDALKAQEWGLAVGKDATATTSEELNIEKGDYLKYGGSFYRITAISPYDSHTTYICKAVE